MKKIEKDFFNAIRMEEYKQFDAMIDIVDIEMVDDVGFTPLLLASYTRNAIFVKALLKKGADVNATIKDKDNSLHFAAYNNDPHIAEMLIKAGIDINNKGYEDRVPITLAITEDSWETFKVIYKAKPNMNIENDVGRSPEKYIYLKPEKDNKKYHKIMKTSIVGKFARLLK